MVPMPWCITHSNHQFMSSSVSCPVPVANVRELFMRSCHLDSPCHYDIWSIWMKELMRDTQNRCHAHHLPRLWRRSAVPRSPSSVSPYSIPSLPRLLQELLKPPTLSPSSRMSPCFPTSSSSPHRRLPSRSPSNPCSSLTPDRS